jgi:CcmD family protein
MAIVASAQSVEMADTMRSEGKIYVVVVVVAIVISVISFYLIQLDRRIKRLENKIREENKSFN